MYYVYMLKNITNNELYYGYTNNVERRATEHGDKWKVIYYEAYASESDARAREKNLKQYGQARTHIKKRAKISLQN